MGRVGDASTSWLLAKKLSMIDVANSGTRVEETLDVMNMSSASSALSARSWRGANSVLGSAKSARSEEFAGCACHTSEADSDSINSGTNCSSGSKSKLDANTAPASRSRKPPGNTRLSSCSTPLRMKLRRLRVCLFRFNRRRRCLLMSVAPNGVCDPRHGVPGLH